MRTAPARAPRCPDRCRCGAAGRLWDRFFDNYIHLPMQKVVGDNLRPEGSGTPPASRRRRRRSPGAGRSSMPLWRATARIGRRARPSRIADCAAAPAIFTAMSSSRSTAMPMSRPISSASSTARASLAARRRRSPIGNISRWSGRKPISDGFQPVRPHPQPPSRRSRYRFPHRADGFRINYRYMVERSGRLANLFPALASSPATGSRSRRRRASGRCSSISPRCAPARCTCRSTPPIRWPSSTTSSAMPSRRCSSAGPSSEAAMRGAGGELGVTRVETLGARRAAAPVDGARRAGRLRRRRARRRRSRRDPLHVGHHRPLEGRDAEPRQSRLQRADAARALALHAPTTC